MIATNRLTLILLLSLLAAITWIRYDVIWASAGSLLAFVLLTLDSWNETQWNTALLEYWVAAVVWVSTFIWLLWRMVFHSRSNTSEAGSTSGGQPSPGYRLAHVVLGFFVFTSLTAPFLSPRSPSQQGQLATTRLLPPLSRGYIVEVTLQASSQVDGWRKRLYMQSAEYLLHRADRIVGGDGGQPPGSVPEARRRTIVFFFGTDDNGRDVLSRVMHGGRVSLGIGLLAALGSALIGTWVGFVAGMSGRGVDVLLMRTTDLFLSIPALFLVIALMAFLGQSLTTLVLTLAITGWMTMARVVRGEVVALRDREFILAARLLHVPRRRILMKHILPNLRHVILTGAVLQFANATLGEAALGFLGLGVQPPTASWGNMMGEATGYLSNAWWLGFFPGLVLAIVIVAAHYVGEETDPYISNRFSLVERLSE